MENSLVSDLLVWLKLKFASASSAHLMISVHAISTYIVKVYTYRKERFLRTPVIPTVPYIFM